MVDDRASRAMRIAAAGGVLEAVRAGSLPAQVEVSLAEGVVLGLVAQGVRRFVGIFGHGSTEIGEVLRVYEEAGVLRTHAVRNEVEAAHVGTALRWVTGEKAAVFTSIGPGALQALAGSLAGASDGVGVWHLYADETTEAEGPNMQQIPGGPQESFLRIASAMGPAYTLHTPWALPEALRRGLDTVDHPYAARPFYLLLPINTQPQTMMLRLAALPTTPPPPLGAAADEGRYAEAAQILLAAERVVVKVGGGARSCGPELAELLDLVDGMAVPPPIASGTLPYAHPRNMAVGGSKGSISGNHAMEEADALLAVGTRPVCQADMSRTGYPNVAAVVNVNADLASATHYTGTLALVGDARATLRGLVTELKAQGATPRPLASPWARACVEKKNDWQDHKRRRLQHPTLLDPVWGRDVLTQPAAIELVTRWARHNDAVCFFDAGDVQANGFQVTEDDRPNRTVTETGASYMGFACSALVTTGIAERPFFGVALTGDGSFTMNPQVLIDGMEHGAHGVIVLFDNRRQGAISSLQRTQYGHDYATNDTVEVDYRALAGSVAGVLALHGGHTLPELETALDKARAHDGLSLIHVPVYFGDHELGGLGSFGRWNVGSWVRDTQALRHGQEL